MTTYLFNPPAVASLPVRGKAERFPINRLFFVGRNYHAHAVEMGRPVDKSVERPFYFTKSPQTLVESGATVPYPPQTTNFHFEMELVVAIGAPGFRVRAEDAHRLVYGYATGLDMTRRDLQLAARDKGRPWDLGKDVEQSSVASEIVPMAGVLIDKGEIQLAMYLTQSLKALDAGAILATTAFGAGAQALKLGHITPPSHVWHQVSEKIAADLDKASGGKMKIAVSPLQKLGNEAQMINLMQAGAQQFGIFTVGGVSNREESFQAWSLPYVFKDVAHASRAAGTPAAQEMLKRLDQHGLVGLGYAFAGMRHVLSVQPVASSKDLAGKKIRSFPSPIYNDWWSANGAAPTVMPLSEVAPSLTTRLLDAVDIDLDALVGLKFYQQAPNLTLTGHMAFPAVIVVSKKWWDSRTPAEREMIGKVVADAAKWGYQAAIDADVNNLAKAKADGVTVVNADIKSFQAVGSKIRDQYTAKNPLIADFYKQAKDL